MQIGRWTLKGFREQQTNIELFLKLTRKNVDALNGRELGRKFQPSFDTFCKKYDKLEKEYRNGIVDHRIWGKLMHSLSSDLTQSSHLL